MIESQQSSILIFQGKDKDMIVESKSFDNVRDLNACFNEINSLKCNKEIWLDEAYISIEFKTVKSFFKALKVLQSYTNF